jgi:hypothetical protein
MFQVNEIKYINEIEYHQVVRISGTYLTMIFVDIRRTNYIYGFRKRYT